MNWTIPDLYDANPVAAVANGWSGVLVHGCVRDVEALAKLPLAVKALAVCLLKTGKLGVGEVDVEVAFAGTAFVPGHWRYADRNGVIVAASGLLCQRRTGNCRRLPALPALAAMTPRWNPGVW